MSKVLELQAKQIHSQLVKEQRIRAAAWLVMKHRRAFLRTRAVEFKLPRDRAIPPWFSYAIEALKNRSGWIVRTHETINQKIWVIIWVRTQHRIFDVPVSNDHLLS